MWWFCKADQWVRSTSRKSCSLTSRIKCVFTACVGLFGVRNCWRFSCVALCQFSCFLNYLHSPAKSVIRSSKHCKLKANVWYFWSLGVFRCRQTSTRHWWTYYFNFNYGTILPKLQFSRKSCVAAGNSLKSSEYRNSLTKIRINHRSANDQSHEVWRIVINICAVQCISILYLVLWNFLLCSLTSRRALLPTGGLVVKIIPFT